MPSPRQRFVDFVRRAPDARPIVSPFLPKPGLVSKTLRHLGLPAGDDASDNLVSNEIRLAQALDYEPMFMTACETLIFPWSEDPSRSDDEHSFLVLDTPEGEWTRRVSRQHGVFGDPAGFAVQTEADHEKLQAVCAQTSEREPEIRRYFASSERR